MVSFLILSLLIFHSYANNLKRSTFSFSPNNVSHEVNDINSNLFQFNYPKILSAKQPKDFICNRNDQTMKIDNENFQTTAKIASEEGCASISVSHCTFTNVVIPDLSQPNGQISIIYIKSIDFFIDDSSFTNCYSNSKIQRTNLSLLESRELSSKNLPISEYVICHAIYLDENVNHEVKITNCDFIDNGIPTKTDGTIIYSNKVNNILIESSRFESNTIFSRAIETFNTQNIELNSNLFNKMTGPKGSNGGALLIQYANNVTISNNIFDSNTLQPIEDATPTSEVCGSAFFINLNDILSFTNNTITNHDNFLNSVITFNSNELYSYNNDNDNLPIKRKVTIYDSKFINNSYSKATDGNGIGLYIEDYSENLPETDDVEPYILQIEFSDCLFENNGNAECSSSVLEWSRKTSFIKFTNCNFESNTAKKGSSMFKILNGLSFQCDSIQISKFNNQSFLQFLPTTTKQIPFIKQIEVTLSSSTFSNEEGVITDKIESNFILTEGTTNFEFNLNLVNCSFSDIFLSSENYLIKSNSDNLKVTNCDFIYSQNDSGNHAISSTRVDGNITVIDSEFQNCLYGLNSIELSENIKITNCDFIDCRQSPVIYGKSKSYFAENCNVSFTSLQVPGFYGMQIDQALNIEITNSDFRNTGRSAIRSFYDLESSMITATSCNIKGCRSGIFAFHSTNKVVNFINSTIFNEEGSDQKSNGFCTESISEITIESCKFINCYNSQSNGNVGGAITCLKSRPNPRESYTFSNCEFTGCTYRNSICYIDSNFEVPRFINVIISKSVSSYLINVIVPQLTEGVVPTGVFLFQNVSFIDIENVANGGGGIGFWFQPQNTFNSDYTLSFLECRFVNTYWSGSNINQYGGGAISIESPSCRKYHISIILCSFYNTTVNGYHGSAIAVVTEKSIMINDCYLQNCSVLKDNSNYGGCIYANEVGEIFDFDMVNVTINGSICNSDTTAVYFTSFKGAKYSMMSCSFINCNKKDASQSSIIYVPQNSLEFHCTDTKFIFDESTNTNSRGVDVHTPVFIFEDCYFYKCGRPNFGFGGGINYAESRNINKDEEIEISLCTFEQCTSNNCGAFRLTIYNGLPILYNNTFYNITANYILALMFSENVIFSHINLNKQYFIKCNNLQSDGGGSGIWINNHRADGNIYPTYIDFNECEFIENVATNCGGGAYGVGTSTSVRPTSLNFLGCSFIGNTCIGSDGGGAIWIRTSISSYVSSCIFKDNRSGNDTKNLHGGAIYIRFTTSAPRFSLSDSEFTNNSCVNPSSNGHVLYGIYLFAAISIDSCQFIDNGIDRSPNSLIYTNSDIQSHFCSYIFTNKETSNSRALYVGSSSELNLYYCDFINCTDLTEKAGSIYYEISSARSPMFIEISYCTYDRNTEGTKSCEMFFYVLDLPSIRDCTFVNENTLSDLVIINFDETVTEIEPIQYVESPALTCNNCNLNNNFIFGLFENLDRHVVLNDFTMYWWSLNSCTNFFIIDNKVIDFFIYNSNFNDNSNNGILLHFSVDGSLEIDDCNFNNNKVESPENEDSIQTGIFFIEKSSNAKMSNTAFESEDIKENGFVLKSLIDLELSDVTIHDCPQNSFSLLFSIEDTQNSKILMKNCIIDKSGPVTIDKRIDEIVIKSSYFSNSLSGFHYKPELNEALEELNSTVNSIQISDTTFDNFTNYALLLIVFDEISITNNIIKNCQKNDENESSPFFELDLKSNSTDQICFEKFTFENNKFNNANNRLMNGGGIGLFISFPDLGDGNQQVITIDFIECKFISNKAAQCGGAFAFISRTEGVVISNSTIYTSFCFQNCTFRMNSCNKLRGHALYIEASNVSIEDCTFEGHSFLSTSSDTIDHDINDVLQSSVVYITTAKNDSFSIQNCSFLYNKASSLYILNCEDEVLITGCLFESNDIMSINSTFSSNNDAITDDIISSSIITIISAKDSITIENCTFHNNSEDSDNKDEIVRASTIFANTRKSFTMKNTNFFDNNINDAIVIALSDVFINNCKFVVLENASFVVGCALVINSKMKIDVCDCTFSGYSSSVYNQQNSKVTVLCPIQIESNDSVTLTDIEVLDVSGDVFNITSNESVKVCNCVFDSNSTDDEVVENSQNDDEVVGNYFIICRCEKFVSFESLRVLNYDKAFSFMRRAESITLKNCQIENCQSGAVFKREILDHMSLKEGTSLLIENVTFLQLKNALIVKESYDQIYLEKVAFGECRNLENEADKDAIFVISIFESQSVVNVNLNDVKFERNRYSQSTQFDSGGGGIGFVISPHDSTTSAIVAVEFNSCTFESNCASNSGGAVHFTSPSNSNSLSFESVSFNFCNFKQNKANVDTGALHITPSNCSSITVTNCTFESNTANRNTGSLHISPSHCTSITVNNVTFDSNRAKENIGSLHISPSHCTSITVDNVTFDSNRAKENIGSLQISPLQCTTITVTNCFFTSNEANGNIGAFSLEDQGSEPQEARVFSCEFLSNRCNGSVAALDISVVSSSSSKTSLSSCTFTLNEAGFSIGAVRIDCLCNFLLDLCSFVNNTAIEDEEEGNSLSPIGTRADSLLLAASLYAEVSRSNFTKAVFIDEDCGYQAVFVNRIESGRKVISLNRCLFSIVNPVVPQILFIGSVGRSNTTVIDSSFTHFYAFDEDDDDIEMNDREGHNVTVNSSVQTKFVNFNTLIFARSNLSAPFYHIECSANSQVSLVDCCFDTNRSFVLSPTAMKHSRREETSSKSEVHNKDIIRTNSKSEVHNKDIIKTNNKSVKNSDVATEKVEFLNFGSHQIRDDVSEPLRVVFVNASFDSGICAFPSIVTDLINAIAEPKNNTGNNTDDIDRKRNKRRRALIIGLSVGATALVIIAVVVVVIVVVYKKKHKEMKKTMQYDEECQEKMEQEEIDAINERYNQNDEIVASKSSKVENLDSADDCEETDLEEFDL